MSEFNVFFYCLTAPTPGILTWKNQSLQHRGKSPVQGFFCENSISPVQGQSFTHRGTLIFKVLTHHSTNTVERNMAHLLLSCSQIFFWNWSRTEKNIGVFKSMRLILCERKHLNIGFHPYPKLYAGILFHDFRWNMSRTHGTFPVQKKTKSGN